MKMRINTKLVTYILSCTILTYVVVIGYLSYQLRQTAMNDTKILADSYAAQYANQIKGEFNVDLGVARALAYSFTNEWDLDFNTRLKLYKSIITSIYKNTGTYSELGASLELSTFGENYTKDYGRIRPGAYLNNGNIEFTVDSINLDGDIIGSQYYDIKLSKMETFDEPYLYSSTGKKEDEKLTSSICVPIIRNNKYAGIGTIDFVLERTQKIVDKIKIFNNSTSYLIAYNGKYVSHPDKNFYNKSFADEEPDINKKQKVIEKIMSGETFSFIEKDHKNTKYYYSFAPIKIGKTNTPWSLVIAIPVKEIVKEANEIFIISLIVGIIGLLIITFVIWKISGGISSSLAKTTDILKKLDKGIIDKSNKLHITTKDEVGEMASYVNNLIDGLNNTAEFARQVGKGNLEAEFSLLSGQDVLGSALLEMRGSLKKAKEDEEKRKHEDFKTNWTTDGLAKFGEILRYNVDNMEEFGYSIISNLVKYIDANQGGIYLINNDDTRQEYIELIASYAYDRKKATEKRIEFGEGIIAQCILEQGTIYIKEIPDNYITIRSGLGDAKPKTLLIVPLKFNDKVYGAIEIASFNEFEPYQIDFSEKIAESIATTISTIKINIRTAKLLEESKEKSERMAMQEEEIRQNMEEMQATQEEMSRTIAGLEKKRAELLQKIEEKEKEKERLRKK